MRKVLFWSLGLLGTIITLSMLLIAAVKSSDQVSSTFYFVESMQDSMRLFRWSVLVLIVAGWGKLIDAYALISQLSDEQIEYGKSLQWRVAIMLLTFDLVVIEALPMKVIG